MSRRPPNELESRLHQAALSSAKKELTAKQTEAIIPDPTERQDALNFLLGVGLFKGLKSSSGQLVFRAVSKEELVATKGLNGEENLVLGHIKSSGNEGIWTKHLKAKTSLHQTVIDRCLKTLTQKRLIKRVQSVQHITRKIYMLEGIEPSISLTGGPWYTDNELDTEFIQNLTDACYKLISDVSFPKRRNGEEKMLYPISNAPPYPTADKIRSSLKKARLTETELTVEHVEMLLKVLILDGKIEKLPAFGSALWNSDAITDTVEESDEDSAKSRKKRKKFAEEDEDAPRSKKMKIKKLLTSDEDSSSNDESTLKKSKRKRSKDMANSDPESDQERKIKKKKKKKKNLPSDSEISSDEEILPPKKGKKKKTKSSDDDSSSESGLVRRKSKKSAKSSRRSPSSSPVAAFLDLDTSGGGSVYRALKEATISPGLMEAPCGICPSFEFCKDGGPVNPRECVYYGNWLDGMVMVNEVDT